jgi:uncharacterized membrane protein
MVVGLPNHLQLFPPWLPYVVGITMLAPMALVAARKGDPRWVRLESVCMLVAVTIIIVVSLMTMGVVISEMLSGSVVLSGIQLITSSVNLWATNITAASLVYWHLDRGGPAMRAGRTGPPPDWRFPRDDEGDEGSRGWTPTYVDYLFLAFTTATAFSPTDTVPLTGRAKLLMMGQALVALVTMVVVAARAVGELGP